MERTTEDIERLLERWYDAATTDDEERELREWFRESGTLPAGLESARRMFAGFEALGAEKAGSEVLHPEADCPEEPAGTDVASCSKESFRLRRAAFWLSAAAVVAGIRSLRSIFRSLMPISTAVPCGMPKRRCRRRCIFVS